MASEVEQRDTLALTVPTPGYRLKMPAVAAHIENRIPARDRRDKRGVLGHPGL